MAILNHHNQPIACTNESFSVEGPLVCTEQWLERYDASRTESTGKTWEIWCDRETLLRFVNWNWGTSFCVEFMQNVEPIPGTKEARVPLFLAPVNFADAADFKFKRKRDAEKSAAGLRELYAFIEGKLGREFGGETPSFVRVVKR